MPFSTRFDYSYDGVMRSYEASLHRLGMARIDILLVHDIGRLTHGDDHARHFRDLAEGGYRALDELRGSGDVVAFGLGVNETQVCEEAMGIGRFDCFLVAGRYTLLEQAANLSLLPKCRAHGAFVIVGGPYNSGVLATGTRSAGAVHYDYGPAPEHVLARVRRIEAIADAHGVTLAAAALQFPLAHSAVRSVIPGVARAQHVAQTMALMAEDIPSGFWADLRQVGLIAPDSPTPERGG